MMNQASNMGKKTGPSLNVVPLGGLGEFGMNMLLVSWGKTNLLVDAGVMFPGPDLPGVAVVIPDLHYLEEQVGHVTAVVLTHGHEDHVGALPYIWPLLEGCVYGSPLTLALVAPKLEEHGIQAQDRLWEVLPLLNLTSLCKLSLLNLQRIWRFA